MTVPDVVQVASWTVRTHQLADCQQCAAEGCELLDWAQGILAEFRLDRAERPAMAVSW
ncbi:hypothetical protein [Micromonospora sp. KC213]|uniref:hypothetical protein n=1 Tax=Micromonospora sp. KC213 TaxID=2530378 RepID=UPI00140430A5|nr:hypothetical protein [Micromonospora sp. KC213]